MQQCNGYFRHWEMQSVLQDARSPRDTGLCVCAAVCAMSVAPSRGLDSGTFGYDGTSPNCREKNARECESRANVRDCYFAYLDGISDWKWLDAGFRISQAYHAICFPLTFFPFFRVAHFAIIFSGELFFRICFRTKSPILRVFLDFLDILVLQLIVT